MKSLALAAAAAIALAAAPTVSAQAFSNPTGYVTETLRAGQFNLIGLTVHQPVEVAGTFDTVSGTTLTSVGAFSGLTAGSTYILEITSGAAEGAVQEITTFDANSITTPDDLSAQLTTSDTYAIRKASTINDVFGENNESGLLGTDTFTASNADNILIPNASGGFTTYYYSNSPSFEGWLTGTSEAGGTPIIYTDAVFVFRRGNSPADDLDLVVSGAVKTSDTQLALSGGNFNFVSSGFPVGSNLGNSGLSSFVEGTDTFVASNADNVLIPNGSGGFDTHFFSTAAGFSGWFSGTTPSDDQVLPSAFIIFRRSSDAGVSVSVPPEWAL